MDLEISTGNPIGNVSEEDLLKVFQKGLKSEDYIILSQSEQVYLQAGKDRDGFMLEYRDGSKDKHFESTRKLTQSEIQSVFLKYLKHDSGWKFAVDWQPLSIKPWWKFW